MNYNSAQIHEMQEEEEEKGQHKVIKIKKRGSDYDSVTRYIAAKGHREAYEKLEKELAEEAEQEYQPEPEPRKHKTISVTRYTPEAINHKTIRIKKYEKKDHGKSGKSGKSTREAAKELGEYVGEKIKKGFHEVHGKKTEIIEAEPVEDEDTIRTVSRALTTRSQKLRDIENDAYNKQYAVEKGKREARENTRAKRKGQLKAMPVFDRTVETLADTTQDIIDVREKLAGARAKILHTSGKPATKKPTTKKEPVLTAVQKRALGRQLERAANNIKPKRYSPPFAVSKPDMSALTAKSSGNPFAGSRKGNPFGSRRPWRL